MSTSTILGFTDLGDRVINQPLPTATLTGRAEGGDGLASLKRPAGVPVPEWYEVDRTLAAITTGGYRRVALQFPDHLLPDAPAVVALLQDRLTATDTGARVFVLGDTSFAACCVDEVAAAVSGRVCGWWVGARLVGARWLLPQASAVPWRRGGDS